MSRHISGRTVVAGVAGAPVAHSLSPLVHNAWLAAAGVDGVYVPFSPPREAFARFVEGLRGAAIRGLNVTVPFKEDALAVADETTDAARAAGAANLLVFESDGVIRADNTDGVGLLGALAIQVPGFDVTAGPALILGAGGAARGAAAALRAAGCPEVRLVNRTHDRAETIADALGAGVSAVANVESAIGGARLIVNATSLGLGGGEGPAVPFARAPAGAAALDMVYRPLNTDFLRRAQEAGLAVADGLQMLIAQAAPSYAAFFGAAPPDIDVRSLCIAALDPAP